MLKKLVKAGTTFTLLLGCYFVYVRAFGFLVEHVSESRPRSSTMFVARDSKSKLEAIAIARAAFGKSHWSGDRDLPYRYYSAERGFWIYAKQVWRISEENGVKYDGKRLRMTPFALVSRSRDGRVTKTVESDEAIFDLNEPLSLNVSSNGESLKIKHARIERNVMIRDDHGTPSDPSDDMRIGPLSIVEYDAGNERIESPSDVVIQDRDIRVTGRHLEITLWSDQSGKPGGGFGGAKQLRLFENVHVVMRDVGKSGLLPGASDSKRSVDATVTVDQTGKPASKASQPTPLDLRCDSEMQVDLPRPSLGVEVGPPEPPAPTFVRFDRNVVVLRGPASGRPDQLTCDTLRLTMVPNDATGARAAQPRPTQATAEQPALASRPPEQSAAQPAQNPSPSTASTATAPAAATEPGASPPDDGLFGGLTLERAHATGHAVWLLLPTSGVKLRCNELIHKKQNPLRPDETYFRGDLTRPLELEKLDYAPDSDKVTAVTHVWTIDATLFDDGSGLDSADVVAHGPGRLETRPDRDQPVDRIAVWQDKLVVLNEVDDAGRIVQKIVDLTGTRPAFIDKLQETRLDSGRLLRIWLKPKPRVESSPDARLAQANPSTKPEGTSVAGGVKSPEPRGEGANPPGSLGLGGGGFRIDRLLAYRDAHLQAPARVMTARQRLDAEFVEDPAPVAAPAAQPVVASTAPATPAPAENPAPEETPASAASQPEQASRAMVGSADRIWARVALLPEKPKPKDTAAASQPQEDSASVALAAQNPAGVTPAVKPQPSKPGGLGSRSEIRKVWLFGSVAVHQDPAPGKSQADEAYGEAMYLENPGPGRAITHIYHRDPTEEPPRPGPLPLAWVVNEDRSIKGELIRVDQAADRVYVDGPGTSTQLADRNFLSDKKPEEEGESETQPEVDASGRIVRTTSAASDGGAAAHDQTRTTAPPAGANSTATAAGAESEPKPAPKPRTRAGKPLSQKAPYSITWTKKMEFFGRSRDPDGNPCARAIFYGKVRADMEDGLIQCEDHMITYTDREVPLAHLGALAQATSKSAEDEQAEDESRPKPELALVECFQKAVAINRKVDPVRPVELERQMIQGDYLRYDKRTGEFYVPGKGYVHLYDRSSGQDAAMQDGSANPGEKPSASRNASKPAANAPESSGREKARKGKKSKSDELPPLVLTQIKFMTGMRGRFGVGKSTDVTETRWAEFFGYVETVRAKVPDVHTFLKPDKLPKDGFFLTGQTLRVITEPPPPGSPRSTPSRNYLKAWDNAYVWSQDKTMQADVITYDSYKDLIYAYGENGRGVVYAQQYAVGQPAPPETVRAVQLNPKTGGAHFIDGSTISTIDQRTGVRPTRIEAPEPFPKVGKKKKGPVRVPFSNMERRDFNSQ